MTRIGSLACRRMNRNVSEAFAIDGGFRIELHDETEGDISPAPATHNASAKMSKQKKPRYGQAKIRQGFDDL
jgi:hypothetical protein